jgi:hypothetical protein
VEPKVEKATAKNTKKETYLNREIEILHRVLFNVISV